MTYFQIVKFWLHSFRVSRPNSKHIVGWRWKKKLPSGWRRTFPY